ncbi:hypothetical protein LCGC14_1935540, partial [marine sediment metagenome]
TTVRTARTLRAASRWPFSTRYEYKTGAGAGATGMGANLVADRAPARVIGLQREVSMSGWLPASIAHNIEMMHVPKEPRADDATDVMRDVPLDDRVPSTVDGGDEVLLIHYPEGFPNDIDANDDHSVELFQPSITLDKTGDALSKVGDDVAYTVVITNTSSADSPDLVIDSISDTLQGDLTDAANFDSSDCGASLAPSASCTIVYTYTVQGGDPDPLLNTASVETHPEGFPNDIASSDDHSSARHDDGA